jgi:outer membrane protein W
MMVEGGYTYSLINTSAPINFLMGSASTNMFDLKQNSFDAGAKFFFLGRESRFRPFIGGGLAFSNSTLNFTPTYSSMLGMTDDYKIKQFQGIGQLGAEIAITRGIVATAAFRFNGILSSSVQSIKNASSATGLEANKVQAGESLSRSASYTGSVGVGVYF